ncbi:MAG: trimethylamine methyltransferase family protein, partial [Candidatus Omnitrophica bacterium]|nr:trimethylamine methyltransferase family protein [Candidatus Omnitrophota bacterium]
NEEWRKKLEPQGFPVIYLTDATGRPYAETGYQPGGAEKFLADLEQLRQKGEQRDKALEAAANSSGSERAKHLDEALTAVGDALAVKFYRQEHWQPEIFSRETLNAWLAGSHLTAEQKAKEKAENILRQYHPQGITETTEQALLKVINQAYQLLVEKKQKDK